MKHWQLQDAKAKFSELVKQAVAHGPQVITVHGQPLAILLSQEEYNHLTKPKDSLVNFLQKSPLKKVELNLKRDKSPSRDITL